jgi:hypothetical protein
MSGFQYFWWNDCTRLWKSPPECEALKKVLSTDESVREMEMDVILDQLERHVHQLKTFQPYDKRPAGQEVPPWRGDHSKQRSSSAGASGDVLDVPDEELPPWLRTFYEAATALPRQEPRPEADEDDGWWKAWQEPWEAISVTYKQILECLLEVHRMSWEEKWERRRDWPTCMQYLHDMDSLPCLLREAFQRDTTAFTTETWKNVWQELHQWTPAQWHANERYLQHAQGLLKEAWQTFVKTYNRTEPALEHSLMLCFQAMQVSDDSNLLFTLLPKNEVKQGRRGSGQEHVLLPALVFHMTGKRKSEHYRMPTKKQRTSVGCASWDRTWHAYGSSCSGGNDD